MVYRYFPVVDCSIAAASLSFTALYVELFKLYYFIADFFNGDGKPDNITFMIKRIKVHNMNALKDPLYRFPGNYGVEKFLELFSGNWACSFLAHGVDLLWDLSPHASVRSAIELLLTRRRILHSSRLSLGDVFYSEIFIIFAHRHVDREVDYKVYNTKKCRSLLLFPLVAVLLAEGKAVHRMQCNAINLASLLLT